MYYLALLCQFFHCFIYNFNDWFIHCPVTVAQNKQYATKFFVPVKEEVMLACSCGKVFWTKPESKSKKCACADKYGIPNGMREEAEDSPDDIIFP